MLTLGIVRAELARCEVLRAKLDAACERLEADARAEAEAARPAYEAKKAGYEARKGRRRRPPVPPDDAPLPERQNNLTDPDSALMRRSDAHEYRQATNAQAVVCADGAQLIVAQLGGYVGRCTELCSHDPGHAGRGRAASMSAGRHRLYEQSGRGSACRKICRATGGHRADPAAPALRLPPATLAENVTTDHRTMADRDACAACTRSPPSEF